MLDRRETQCVDRRFAHRDAGQGTGPPGRRNSVLVPPAENLRKFGAAHLDAGHSPASSLCANQALPRGPSRTASAARAAVRISPAFRAVRELAPGRRPRDRG